jgi:hypothetical protein
MKGFFWSRIKFKTDDLYKASEWSKCDDTKIVLNKLTIEAAFRKKDKKKPAGGAGGVAKSKKKEKVSLVDGKRQQNVAIALGRFRMPYSQIREIIVSMDSMQLTAERTRALIKIVPNKEESETVSSYDGDKSLLMETEKFFLAVLDIPRLAQRLTSVATIHGFDEQMQLVTKKQQAMKAACTQLEKSNKLRKVVSVVLAMGNYLNGSTTRGGAYGFKLEGLSKLSTVKTSDNKSTLMHFLASTLEKDYPDLKDWPSDVDNVIDVASESMSQAEKDFNMLKKELKAVALEIEKADGPGADNFKRKMKVFMRDAESRRDSCTKAMDELWDMVAKQIVGWGEAAPKRNTEPDPLSSFFTYIAKFAALYKRAVAENKRKAEMEAKRKRQEAEKAARAAARAKKGASGKKKRMSLGADDDVFGTINRKLKQGNANDIIAEFKNRHARTSGMSTGGKRLGRKSSRARDNSAAGGAMRNELAAVLGRRKAGK